jgi:uncharacterized protein
MKQFLRWFPALPFALTVAMLGGPASASTVRDEAGMFSAGAVRSATAQLDRFEKATRVPVIIVTVEDLSLGNGASKAEKHRAIEKLAIARDRESGNHGIFLLISKADRVISNTLIPAHLATVLPEATRIEIRDAFIKGIGTHMKAEGRTSAENSDLDAGLKSLVSAIERTTDQIVRGGAGARHANPVPANGHGPVAARRPGAAHGGSSGMMTFLMIGLGIIAVLFLVRLLGGLFGGSAGPARMGGMGMPGRGMGPGYGGPGYGPAYGGRGGGFFSGMLGGLGGALAGNWLYDQFSGRHGGGHIDASSYPTSESTGGYFPQGDEPIIGGDDGGNGGASWGDAGGDWGGGDGGADWGGGGGDWGGGDWGGGDGGGDW